MSNTPLPVPASDAPLGPAARTGNTAFATSIGLLLLRLALGWTFIFHGAQHAFGAFHGPGIEGTAGMFATMGLPSFLSPTAWAILAGYGEFLGGITIFLGLFARLGTIPVVITMLVAIATFHGPKGFSLGDGGYEYNLNLIAMATVILLAGPGLISLDALLFRRGLWAKGAQPLANPGTRT